MQDKTRLVSKTNDYSATQKAKSSQIEITLIKYQMVRSNDKLGKGNKMAKEFELNKYQEWNRT